MNEIKFAEWLAENHYKLANIEKGIYYWSNENFTEDSQSLYDIFKAGL